MTSAPLPPVIVSTPSPPVIVVTPVAEPIKVNAPVADPPLVNSSTFIIFPVAAVPADISIVRIPAAYAVKSRSIVTAAVLATATIFSTVVIPVHASSSAIANAVPDVPTVS